MSPLTQRGRERLCWSRWNEKPASALLTRVRFPGATRFAVPAPFRFQLRQHLCSSSIKKIPNIGSPNIVWTYTGRNGQRCSCGHYSLIQVRRPECVKHGLAYLKSAIVQLAGFTLRLGIFLQYFDSHDVTGNSSKIGISGIS